MEKRLFVLCSCLVLVSSLRPVPLPFRSKKSPSEIIDNYEIIDPGVSEGPEYTQEGHAKNIVVSLQSEEETFELNLILNEFLLSPNFASRYHKEGKNIEESHDSCFYQGTVSNYDGWSVAISTCHGIRGTFGDLSDPNKLYHIEPLEDTPSFTSPLAFYKDSVHKMNKDGTCGTHSKHGLSDADEISMSHDSHKISKRQSSETLIVEWLLVNDFFQYINYNRNISAVALRAIELANYVDMLYQPLGVRVTLVYSLTWTDEQQIAQTTDSGNVLDEFEEYHRLNADFRDIVHDSAMLITGIEIDGSTVGVAFLGTMCFYDDSVGFTQDTGSTIQSVGSIAAHELGHILNMQHDDAPGCQCPDENGCIMNAALGFPPPVQFSQCSRNHLAEGFDAGRDICLDNSPTMIFGDPACGNGIKEPGEVCDCGSLEECRDPCCNATTCTLSEGSDCAEGECCTSSCKFVEYGTTCRVSRGVCGILEYCTGTAAECPRDVYAQNGISCENGTSYCYDGQCTSLTGQCMQYYGEESQSSARECFDRHNVQGEGYGHCGVQNGQFVQCATENTLCGSIQCSGGSIMFSNIDFTGSATSFTRFVLVEGTFEECQSFTTAATSDIISPGLVLEGSKCGNDMLCISQECVSVTTLGATPCPVGLNGEVCSGNGQCNNLDRCSCVVGFNGSDCSEVVITRGTASSNGMMTSTTKATPSVVTIATTTPTNSLPTLIQELPTKRMKPTPLPTTTRTHITPTSHQHRAPPSQRTQHTYSTISKPVPHYSSPVPLLSQSYFVSFSPPSASSNVPFSSPFVSYKTVKVGNSSDVFSAILKGVATAAAIGASVTIVVLLLIIGGTIAGILLAIFVYRKSTSNISYSPKRARYNTEGGRKPGVHGSTDDLLMTGVTSGSSPIPPHAAPTSYKPYVPPSIKPSAPPTTVVSQNVRRPPPPPGPSSRPPPPSVQLPTLAKPTPPNNRPTPPVNKPGQAPTKPVAAPRSNLPVKTAPNISYVAPKPIPLTAPKPSKVNVQWPPPSSEDSGSSRPPPPAKKPMVPRKP